MIRGDTENRYLIHNHLDMIIDFICFPNSDNQLAVDIYNPIDMTVSLIFLPYLNLKNLANCVDWF